MKQTEQPKICCHGFCVYVRMHPDRFCPRVATMTVPKTLSQQGGSQPQEAA